MEKAIKILEGLITKVKEKDGAGIYVPRAVDEAIRNKTLQEAITALRRADGIRT